MGTLELEKGTGGPVIMNASNNDYLVLRDKVPRICEGELYWMSCDNERSNDDYCALRDQVPRI